MIVVVLVCCSVVLIEWVILETRKRFSLEIQSEKLLVFQVQTYCCKLTLSLKAWFSFSDFLHVDGMMWWFQNHNMQAYIFLLCSFEAACFFFWFCLDGRKLLPLDLLVYSVVKLLSAINSSTRLKWMQVIQHLCATAGLWKSWKKCTPLKS